MKEAKQESYADMLSHPKTRRQDLKQVMMVVTIKALTVTLWLDLGMRARATLNSVQGATLSTCEQTKGRDW